MPPSTPLLRPRTFFAERDLDVRRLVAVVLLLALAGPATLYGVGWIFTTHIDGTVMVDNPERPPDWICQDDSGIHDREGCDQPRQVQRDVDSVIWSALHGVAGRLLLAGPVAWLLAGLLLHVGSWLAGGERGPFASFGVAAWGMVPSLAAIVALLPVIYVAFDPISVSPGGQASAIDAARAQIRSLRPYTSLSTVATTAWGAVIWRYGLEHERGLDPEPAWLVTGVIALLFAGSALV